MRNPMSVYIFILKCSLAITSTVYTYYNVIIIIIFIYIREYQCTISDR